MRDKMIVMTEGELEAMIERVICKVMINKSTNNEDGPKRSAPLMLSLEDAASFLNLAPQTIYTKTSKRLIPFIKKGKKLYFKKADLEQWLNEGRKKTRSEIESELD